MDRFQLEKTLSTPAANLPAGQSSSSSAAAPPQVAALSHEDVLPPDATSYASLVSGRIVVPKLKGASDWPMWSKTMKNYLKFCQLWDVVAQPLPGQPSANSIIDMNRDDPFGDNDTINLSVVSSQDEVTIPRRATMGARDALLRKSMQAFLEILTAIASDEVSTLIYDVPDGNAYALWHRLQSYYEKRNLAAHSRLMSEFFVIKQEPNEAVELYVARIRKIVLGLQQSIPNGGNAFDRRTVIFRFLQGLLPMFDHARSALEASRDYPSLTFDEAADFIISQASLMQLRRQDRF